MELELTREYYPLGTNGTLACKGFTICATIELPWKNNCARISCIPEGRYSLSKRYSPHFKSHFMLEDVPDRQYILIHSANNAMLYSSRGKLVSYKSGPERYQRSEPLDLTIVQAAEESVPPG